MRLRRGDKDLWRFLAMLSWILTALHAPQHFLYLRPDPQGHSSLRPTLTLFASGSRGIGAGSADKPGDRPRLSERLEMDCDLAVVTAWRRTIMLTGLVEVFADDVDVAAQGPVQAHCGSAGTTTGTR